MNFPFFVGIVSSSVSFVITTRVDWTSEDGPWDGVSQGEGGRACVE